MNSIEKAEPQEAESFGKFYLNFWRLLHSRSMWENSIWKFQSRANFTPDPLHDILIFPFPLNDFNFSLLRLYLYWKSCSRDRRMVVECCLASFFRLKLYISLHDFDFCLNIFTGVPNRCSSNGIRSSFLIRNHILFLLYAQNGVELLFVCTFAMQQIANVLTRSIFSTSQSQTITTLRRRKKNR